MLKMCRILTQDLIWEAEQRFGLGVNCVLLLLHQYISCFSILVNPLLVSTGYLGTHCTLGTSPRQLHLSVKCDVKELQGRAA